MIIRMDLVNEERSSSLLTRTKEIRILLLHVLDFVFEKIAKLLYIS